VVVRRHGAGPYLEALAAALGASAVVTAVVGAGQAGAVPPGIEAVEVAEPDAGSFAPFYCDDHAWSAAVTAALRERWPRRAPALIEFADRGGHGFVTVQARRTGDPWLARTRVAVRLDLTGELAAILDGAVTGEMDELARDDIERYCLRHADALLDPGGDVAGTYVRVYGRLAPLVLAPPPLAAPASAPPPSADAPLRLLSLGPLARGSGVADLVRAFVQTPGDELRLTVAAADGAAPAGAWRRIRDQLEETSRGDARVRFDDAPADPAALVDAHHAVVVPARWAGWPEAALLALHRGRPVLAAPVGGLAGLLADDRAGVAVPGTGARAWSALLRDLAADPGPVLGRLRSGAPAAACAELADPERQRRAYGPLLDPPPAPPARPSSPSVSVVMPYFRMGDYVEEALDSVAAQAYDGPVDVVVVDDGSPGGEDPVLARVAQRPRTTVLTQPNAGVSAARNLGVGATRGELVLPLDADNVLEPGFLERCVRALQADDRLAYATSWSQWVDEEGEPLPPPEDGHAFLGNWSRVMERGNVAGDAVAVIRREVFDAGFAWDEEMLTFEDWALYRRLHRAGLHGDVVPERLFRYRVRGQSESSFGHRHTGDLYAQMNALMREDEVPWTPEGAPAAVPLEPAPLPDADGHAALARANEALLAANERLAAGHTGRTGAAAAGYALRFEDRVTELEGRLAWREGQLADSEEAARRNDELYRRERERLDSPRYRMVDDVRDRLARVPLLEPALRLLWRLPSKLRRR
jgi:hypothetical protein